MIHTCRKGRHRRKGTTMFGRKARKARKATTVETVEARTYSALDYTPHGVAVMFPGTYTYVRPAAWQKSRSAAEDIARQMRRDHPEWLVEVIRK